MARALEQAGAAAFFSATTRSPILPGLAIRSVLEFTDSVADGIPNFLYNVDPADWDRILVTYEGRCQPDLALLAALGPAAQALCLDAPRSWHEWPGRLRRPG
ncbi:TRSP domain-containing protein [Deinococcus lacus]|uniref:TRSP domain-containing protein n=1 Tax=Deinococcus lacus TaxID=392561 RepID=A0ABW1YER6_9DEIO